MMKAFSKRLLSRLVRNDRCWKLLDWLLFRATRYAETERSAELTRRRIDAIIAATFPDLSVRRGPFKGLRFAAAQSVCSALLPKLLGCYERELQETIERLCTRGYATVVDVGCAEGYYAVGLATRMPGAKVHAFDVDDQARALCAKTAALNHVDDQVIVRERCSRDELRALTAGGPALIISDCEGYEIDLFDAELAPALRHADLLIETHDFTGIDISTILAERFRHTHEVSIALSTNDTEKLLRCDYSEIQAYDQETKRFILSERRPETMKWLVLNSRTRAADQQFAPATSPTVRHRLDQ